MRDKIAEEIGKYIQSPRDSRNYELADRILELINAERCVWTKDEDGDWDTECGRCYDHDEVNMPAGYCNGCGKRIEVKDE